MSDNTESVLPTGAFDLSLVDILSPSERGKPMELKHPNGQTYKTSAGLPVVINLMGRLAAPAVALQKKFNEEIAAIRNGGRQVEPDTLKQQDTEYLTALTRSWNIEALDGEPFPCTPQNARKLWEDARFSWVRQRALEFVLADANFLTPPA